jgi:2-phospho-L-lactate transferase/gluconeogenesis factor (CofD/UPF0052 family)
LKVYVCNVATQPGETDEYNVEDHVQALVRHLPGQANPLDVVIAPIHLDTTAALEPGVSLVTTRPSRSSRPQVVVEDVVRDDLPLRHDPDKLARVLMRVYESERRTRASGNGAVRSTG